MRGLPMAHHKGATMGKFLVIFAICPSLEKSTQQHTKNYTAILDL
jgi:hypothetical protein